MRFVAEFIAFVLHIGRRTRRGVKSSYGLLISTFFWIFVFWDLEFLLFSLCLASAFRNSSSGLDMKASKTFSFLGDMATFGLSQMRQASDPLYLPLAYVI
jgi:hypothetical protein